MSAEAQSRQEMRPPGLTARTSVIVWAVLMVLLALTVGAAYLPLGAGNMMIALLVAIAKACLVGIFYMHLRWSSSLSRIFAIAGLFWLVILLGGTVSDVVTRERGTTPVPAPTTSPAARRNFNNQRKQEQHRIPSPPRSGMWDGLSLPGADF